MTTRRNRLYQRRNLHRLVSDAPHAHPHTRVVFALMRQQKVTYDALSERSGVTRATMKAWRKKNKPSLESLSAVLGALSWDYVPVPHIDALPPDLAAEINSLCERFKVALPEVFALLIEAGVYQRALAEHGMKASWRPNLAA